MKSRLAPFLSVLRPGCLFGRSASPSASAAPSVAPTTAASASTAPSAEAVELTIYGAASLKGALEEAKAAYETANPGTTVTLSTGSSSALETQIEQGAPADVFLSADTANPKKLVDAGLTDGAAVTFAGNKLTIIVPTANPAGITTPADLAKSGVKVIAAGDEVPITKYATQLVDNLAKEAGYPADFAAKYTANIASKEEDVKAVVAKIELGEGDAGIVYVTDAKASTKVTTVDVPDTANVPATYAGVVVKASKNAAAARAFLDWFAGPDGQAILSAFRVPAAFLMQRRGQGAGCRSPDATDRRASGWGERSLAALAALFALFLGLPIVTLVARAILDGSLTTAIASPVVLRRALAEPRDHGHQPGDHRRLRLAAGLRHGAPAVPWQGLAGGHRRSPDRPAAVRRGARPAPGLRPARTAGGAVRDPRLSRSRSRPSP